MASEFYIGKRLSFDGQLCTVRYYGEVKGTKGDWLGVEWDDPIRGKHAGENGGVRYFECLSKQPTAGSFVRPTRKADPPRSFVEALKAKYASEDFEDPDVQVIFIRQDKKKDPLVQQNRPIRISGKEVEEVGFDKIRKQLADLKELRIIILDGLRMSRPLARLRERQDVGKSSSWPEGLTDIQDACPKASELDLSRNLFEEWREVASICEQLDKLRSLRADGNRFRDMSLNDVERQQCVRAFKNIKILRLEGTLLSWEDITNITTLFPQVTTFVASSNFYTTLTNHYLASTITDLTLEDNSFLSLKSLHPLIHLPALQRLILKSNKIYTTTVNLDAPLPIFSPTLTEVDLSHNEIATWTFIDSLSTVFPGLTALRISHNPLYHSLQAADGRALSAEDGYMLTLARLGNLKSLNYSPITPKERLNAESYYLSLIARELKFAPESLQETIIASHPRWKYLCGEYGEPVINRTANAINPNSLAARLIKFRFYLSPEAKSSLHPDQLAKVGDGEYEEEIPTSFTAYTVLGLVCKRFGIPPMKCRLIWETGDWIPAPRTNNSLDEDWESDSSDEDQDEDGKENRGGGGGGGGGGGEERIMREVEITRGTRAVGNWIEGMEAVIRVELG